MSDPARQTDEAKRQSQCFECRVVGTTTLGASAAYVGFHAASVPRGKVIDRAVTGALAVGLAAAALWRWTTDAV